MLEREKIIINSCQTCRTPIYQGEPIYSSSKGTSSGYTQGVYGGKTWGGSGYTTGAYGGHYSGAHASEMWAQCAWCYDQWQAEVKANKKFWLMWWLGGILLLIIATFASILIFPGLEGGTKSTPPVPWHRLKLFSMGSLQVPLIALLVLLVGLILIRILGHFLQPNVDRYKLRKRNVINL